MTSTRRHWTRCSDWYRRTNGMNLSKVAVPTPCLALGFDIHVACDTPLHISVGAKMGKVQVTGSLWIPMVTVRTIGIYHLKNLQCVRKLYFSCFVRMAEKQTAIISAYSINWLVFTTEKHNVHSEVRAEYLYTTEINFTPKGLRGTRWRSGWGAALQTGRSRNRFPMVTMEFFIDTILPAALRPWDRLSL
jgi:hypothetical protein